MEENSTTAEAFTGVFSNATLTCKSNSIHKLWDEYEFGISNRKPAQQFTSRERGRCKYTYHRRKVVWDQISLMVRRGWNASEACNAIYAAYGPSTSVTKIINQMRRDKKSGGHPSLRAMFVENI